MKAIQAFKKAFDYMLGSHFCARLHYKPGDFIRKLSNEEREALQNLTASDINDRIDDDVACLLSSKEDDQKKDFVQLKLDFDKKINVK